MLLRPETVSKPGGFLGPPKGGFVFVLLTLALLVSFPKVGLGFRVWDLRLRV